MKRKKQSLTIRLAIVVTTLAIAPTALGLGLFLKTNVIKQAENNVKDSVKTDEIEKTLQVGDDKTAKF